MRRTMASRGSRTEYSPNYYAAFLVDRDVHSVRTAAECLGQRRFDPDLLARCNADTLREDDVDEVRIGVVERTSAALAAGRYLELHLQPDVGRIPAPRFDCKSDPAREDLGAHRVVHPCPCGR